MGACVQGPLMAVRSRMRSGHVCPLAAFKQRCKAPQLAVLVMMDDSGVMHGKSQGAAAGHAHS